MHKRIILGAVGISIFAVLTVSATLYVTVFKRPPNHIFGLPRMSPNGEYLVFKLGYLSPRASPISASAKPRLHVLKLGQVSAQAVELPLPWRVLGATWRPGVSPAQLYAVLLPRHEAARIVSVKVSDGARTVDSHILPDGLTVGKLAWNPSGHILAAYVIKDGEEDAFLGVSYDNGRNINVTTINIKGGNLVWVNDKTFYLQNRPEIFEVDVSDGNPRVTRPLVSGEDVHLAGSLNEKVIYTRGNQIYCGQRLLHTSDQQIGIVDAHDSYIAFQTGDEVVVLDDKGNLISKKKMEDDSVFMGVSCADGHVYLKKNNRSIERYSLVDSDKVTTVYKPAP